MISNVEKCNNTSVGMIVRKDDQILLIERKKYPFGFAPPAGHVDDGESYEDAAKRELLEEVGIDVRDLKVLTEGKKNNSCRRPNGSWHYWKVYDVKINDDKVTIKKDEVKKANWYSSEEIKKLAKRSEEYIAKKITDDEWEKSPGIELVWHDWLRELKII